MPKDTTNINDVIIKSSSTMDKGDFDAALELIYYGLKLSPDNYELNFMAALCYEQKGNIEKAYYLYRLALYLASNSDNASDDISTIQKELDRMCEYTHANRYKLSVSLEKIIIERIHMKEYHSTYYFLKSILYDKNHTAAHIVMTDNNMLLFIMLEIYSCELNSSSNKDYNISNIFERYGCDYKIFREVFQKLRFILRRIRFGIDSAYYNELKDIMSEYSVTGETLAVLVEYCIDPPCWRSTLNKIYCLLQSSYPVEADIVKRYNIWLGRQNTGDEEACMCTDTHTNIASVITLDYNEQSSHIHNKNNCDDSSISIIFCTNDDAYCNECILYLKRLYIPDNMHMDIIAVRNAPGMAAGYNAAMQYSNSKYKIYIHHDTFIIDTHILNKLINVFHDNPDIGLIGNSGSTIMPDDGKWWSSGSYLCRVNLYQDVILNLARCTSVHTDGYLDDAVAIDGIFMATSKDIPWREDLFDHWHFYDISQTYEFRKNGYRTVFLNDDTITILHELSTTPSPVDYYEKYQHIFLENYILAN